MRAFQLADDVSEYGKIAGQWMVTTDDHQSEIAGPFLTMEEALRVASLPVFDGYEVHGCRTLDETGVVVPQDEGTVVEQCDDAEAQFFSVYGHLNTGGVDCIGDFNTRQQAEDVVVMITEPLKRAASIITKLLEPKDLNGFAEAVEVENAARDFLKQWL